MSCAGNCNNNLSGYSRCRRGTCDELFCDDCEKAHNCHKDELNKKAKLYDLFNNILKLYHERNTFDYDYYSLDVQIAFLESILNMLTCVTDKK
jgi:hypothetical protein